MPLTVSIGKNGGDDARIVDEALLISMLPYPALDIPNKMIPFVGAFTVNGDGVTTNLSVDGSVIPVEAFIGASTDGDIWLKTANIVVADTGAVSLNKFGADPALTTGIDFFYSTAERQQNIAIGLKTNFDMIRIGSLTEGIGSKNDAYQLSNLDTNNNDGYNPVLDLTTTSPDSMGTRIRMNSSDRLGICINDDLTGVDTFNVVLIGYLRIE